MKAWLKVILVLLVIVIVLVILSLVGILDNSILSEAETAARTAGGINDATDAVRNVAN